MPSLDGLRAVSIALVIIYHLGLVGRTDIIGNFGVRVFFVISGYLITRLLLEEHESTGAISLRGFYIRRVFRIFPAFYTYWTVIAVCAVAGLIFVPGSDLLQAATYTANYFPGQSHTLYIRHLWSLGVEEQFYLLWPVLLVAAGARRAMWVAAAFVVIDPAIRLVYWLSIPSMRPVIDSRFEVVADALAVGCILAGTQAVLARLDRYNAALRSRWFFLLPVCTIAFAIVVAPRPRTYYGAGITILNIAIGICIDRFVRYPEGAIGSVLNSAPFRAVGVLSYSIYLWQQPFLYPAGTAVYQRYPYNLLCVAAFSATSYFLIERPLLRVGRRLSRKRPSVQAVVA